MAALPSGTVTFLFTDLEGSTRLWEEHPVAMRAALARHDALMSAAIEARNGYVVKTTGDGFLAAFAQASDAVVAAVDAQRALSAEPWPDTGPLRVRMGIHTGAAEIRERDYHGPTLNRAARLMSVGHGGQVLVSLVTSELIRGSAVELVDLGSHRLRGLAEPEHVFQVVAPGLATDFPPLRSMDSGRHVPRSNLPAPVDRFVGRARELAEVQSRLEATRLLTLLGPGGTGKTRLALEVAHGARERFADLVYLVDLNATRDVEAVLAAIARTVGVHEAGERALVDAIKEQIGGDPMLLVVDNLEQVIASAPLLAELLRDCAGLTMLVTSREALNVKGEQVYPLAPLAVPGADTWDSVDELARCEAVLLFVERAREVNADFRLTDDNAAAVAALCVHLDGLPLAIELAAARLVMFSPEALVERLGNRLDLLSAGRRDAPERQRTLRDTIDWSYQLLDDDEQRLFALFSVFAGATLEAAEGVVERVPGAETLVAVDGLASLVAKSLVRQSDGGTRSPRLSMLETVRAFAAERLAADPALRDAVQRAHAAYFADWTMHQCEKLTGDDRERASERMADDIQNLSAAWRYWVAEGDLEELGRLTDGLWLLYDARGWHHEATTLITDLLGVLATTPESDEMRIQQILLQTSLARVQMAAKGFTPETEQAYERALELCETLGEVPQLVPVLRGISTFLVYRAEFEKSRRIGEQLLGLAEAVDDTRARVEGHLLVGVSEGMLAHLDPGIDHLEAGIAAYEAAPQAVERFAAGNDAGVVCLVVDGMLLWMKGRPDRARERALASVALAEQLHQPQSLAYAHFHAGLVHLWCRQPDRAAAHAHAVVEIAGARDFPVWDAAGGCLAAVAVAVAGDAERGFAQLDGAMDRWTALKTPPVFWPSLLQLRAEVLLLADRPEESLACVVEALDVLAGIPEPQMMSSELLVLEASCRYAISGDTAEAAALFERAVERADRLEAPMLQLRASLALARVWRVQGRTGDAHRMLTVAYERLDEGFDTPDLRDARDLLDALADTGDR